VKLTSLELRELELRRSQQDLQDLLSALRADGEIVVEDEDEEPADDDDAAPADDQSDPDDDV